MTLVAVEFSLSHSSSKFQLHEMTSSLAFHIVKVPALETVFAEHESIKCEVGMLRQLVEKRDR